MSSRDIDQKQWALIEQLLLEQTKERRRSLRWSIFFKLLVFVYIFAGLAIAYPLFSDRLTEKSEEHVGLVVVKGPIAVDQSANADAIVGALRRAFEAKSTRAVILSINSPGGSPVQSGYVYDEIVRLRGLYTDKKLYAVISDIGASGAYYIAAAADEIYADKASLVGSIGAVSSGFGFVGLMDKLGVDRRSYVAGKNKNLLDPFSPQDASQTEFWQQVLSTTHRQFIDAVKAGRGDRLIDDPRLFTGLVWTGEQALPLGLIDGLGSAGYVARDVVGVNEVFDYSGQHSTLAAIVQKLGVSLAVGMLSGVEQAAAAPSLR